MQPHVPPLAQALSIKGGNTPGPAPTGAGAAKRRCDFTRSRRRSDPHHEPGSGRRRRALHPTVEEAMPFGQAAGQARDAARVSRHGQDCDRGVARIGERTRNNEERIIANRQATAQPVDAESSGVAARSARCRRARVSRGRRAGGDPGRRRRGSAWIAVVILPSPPERPSPN